MISTETGQQVRPSLPETRNPNPQLETQNPKPETRNPQLETRNPEPETQTRNLKPETRTAGEADNGGGEHAGLDAPDLLLLAVQRPLPQEHDLPGERERVCVRERESERTSQAECV